jgi:hypothetical protein
MSPGILAVLKGKLVMLVYKGAFFHTQAETLSAPQGMVPALYPYLLTIKLSAHICVPYKLTSTFITVYSTAVPCTIFFFCDLV